MPIPASKSISRFEAWNWALWQWYDFAVTYSRRLNPVGFRSGGFSCKTTTAASKRAIPVRPTVLVKN